MVFILSPISGALEFRSVSRTSLSDDLESKMFKNINFLGEISNN